MTLEQFVRETIQEVLSNISDTPEEKSKQSVFVQSQMWITERIIQDMAAAGTITQLNENSRFTPLARDLWKKYTNQQLKGGAK